MLLRGDRSWALSTAENWAMRGNIDRYEIAVGLLVLVTTRSGD